MTLSLRHHLKMLFSAEYRRMFLAAEAQLRYEERLVRHAKYERNTRLLRTMPAPTSDVRPFTQRADAQPLLRDPWEDVQVDRSRASAGTSLAHGPWGGTQSASTNTGSRWAVPFAGELNTRGVSGAFPAPKPGWADQRLAAENDPESYGGSSGD